VYLPASSETHAYDDDGNLTADGRWSYTWDAENRLVSMETVSSAYGVGVPRQLIQFKYDYLGRRIRKTVANWNSMTSTYDATLDRKFLYNGWNLIAEYDVGASSLTLVASYTWGLDLSGNLVDGGGVNGLLAIKQISGSVWHLPYYDANGNVNALVDRSTGTVTAAYEYSPFGETLRANGTYAASNAFRFSRKYTDTETHLLYYGFRYYDPSMGRWLGRDPLGESGGLHLYGFCRNNAINVYDALGLYTFNEIYGGVPDDDVIRQVHPTWSRIDEGYIHGWINPEKPDEVISFVDGEDPATIDYNDSEKFSAPQDNAGTSTPSLLDTINAVFEWNSACIEAMTPIPAPTLVIVSGATTGIQNNDSSKKSGEPTLDNVTPAGIAPNSPGANSADGSDAGGGLITPAGQSLPTSCTPTAIANAINLARADDLAKSGPAASEATVTPILAKTIGVTNFASTNQTDMGKFPARVGEVLSTFGVSSVVSTVDNVFDTGLPVLVVIPAINPGETHYIVAQANKAPGSVTVYDSWPKNNQPVAGNPGRTYVTTTSDLTQKAIGPVVVIIPAPGTPGGSH
jgi:RHS repeat-associated protein